MKRYISLFLCLLLSCALYSCDKNETFPVSPTEIIEELDPAEAYIENYVNQMTLEEKVSQMFFVRTPETTGVEDMITYQVGGYLLFWRNIKNETTESLTAQIASYQEVAKTPLFIGVDEEGGTVTRVSINPNLRSEQFYAPRYIYATEGMDALIQNTAEKDTFLQSFGFNVNFAPVCDVCTTEDAYMYKRSMGVDASETSACISSSVTQMKKDSMGSVLKHFPGYGNVGDTHYSTGNDDRSLQEFRSNDFLPFQAGIQAGANFVLVSHNVVSCMNENLPSSLSKESHQLLRDELGFEGLIITDDLTMTGATAFAEEDNLAVMAVLAGNDMIITTDFYTQIPSVIEAVKNGTIEEEQINTACKRIIREKINLGIMEITND